MQNAVQQVGQLVGAYIPTRIAALVILIVGWLVALILAAVARNMLRRTHLAERIGNWISEGEAPAVDVAQGVGKGIFYLAMLFVLVAFFQVLGLTLTTEPLNQLLNLVFQFAPKILAAGILLLLAWLVATGLCFVLSRALQAARIDERFGNQAGLEEAQRLPLSTTFLLRTTVSTTFIMPCFALPNATPPTCRSETQPGWYRTAARHVAS